MSRTIRSFQVEELGDNFTDNLNDSSVHTSWTQEPGGTSSIVEDGTDLTISDPGGATLEWLDGSTPNAPNISRILEPYNFTVKVYVSGVIASGSNAGAIVHYLDGVKGSYHYVGLLHTGTGYSIYTHGKNVGTQSTSGGIPSSCWLALVRRGNLILSFYSSNAVGSEPDINAMTFNRQYANAFPYNDGRIALAAETKLSGNPAIAIEFRKFRLTYP